MGAAALERLDPDAHAQALARGLQHEQGARVAGQDRPVARALVAVDRDVGGEGGERALEALARAVGDLQAPARQGLGDASLRRVEVRDLEPPRVRVEAGAVVGAGA